MQNCNTQNHPTPICKVAYLTKSARLQFQIRSSYIYSKLWRHIDSVAFCSPIFACHRQINLLGGHRTHKPYWTHVHHTAHCVSPDRIQSPPIHGKVHIFVNIDYIYIYFMRSRAKGRLIVTHKQHETHYWMYIAGARARQNYYSPIRLGIGKSNFCWGVCLIWYCAASPAS